MIAAGYSMDLYCRHDRAPLVGIHDLCPKGSHRFEEFPHQYYGQTFAECKRDAVKQGWKFHRDGEVSCPRCNGK